MSVPILDGPYPAPYGAEQVILLETKIAALTTAGNALAHELSDHEADVAALDAWRALTGPASASTLDGVDQRATGDYAIGQWLSGSTAPGFRPTRDELEAAGYLVVKREDVAKAGVAVLTVSELGALIDVCRGGVSITGSATDALRHLEGRLRARLEQTRTPPCA